MSQRLLLISPVRNEAANIELVAGAVADQTRPPDLWVIVDDDSTDRTPEILAQLAERIDFIQVLRSTKPPAQGAVKDRLATATEARSFNRGLNSVDWRSFTHIAKLDGDTELPPDYFERLLAEFERDPELGLAGGIYADPDPDANTAGDGSASAGAGMNRENTATDAVRARSASGAEDDWREGWEDGWKVVKMPSDYHVAGTLKCYSRDCLQAIGGIWERLGWDTIDETYARMRGYRTRAFEELIVHHHRPRGSADGTLRGRARHGQCAYIVHFTLPWVVLRAFKVGLERPRGLSGLAFVYGYLSSAPRRVPRVDDREFRRFVHRELRERARAELTGRAARQPGLLTASSHEH
jgi:poly-beta-1,6-N-acetyl-D-glucosamine synthase